MLERLDAAVAAALQPLQAATQSKAADDVVQPLAQVRVKPCTLPYIYCQFADNEGFLSSKVLLDNSKDLLSDWLDQQFGSDVSENSIFSTLPKYWEGEYHKDMDALNVSPE